MRAFPAVILISMLSAGVNHAQFAQDFSGAWKLNPARGEGGGQIAPPDVFLRIEQKGGVLTLLAGPGEQGPFRTIIYALDGKETKNRVSGGQMSTMVKWEGAALLTNSILSGTLNYTVMERWKRSRDGSTLTIKRTVVRLGGESEALLVYESPGQAVEAPAEVLPPAPPPTAPPSGYTIEQGTRIPLGLLNPLNTKTAAAGDRVYLQTVYPILDKGHIVIPPGSYVTGTITSSERAGHVKGRAALHVRFDTITLPNGVTRDLRSRVGASEAKVDREGTLRGEGNKSGDARTVGETTAAGASVGAVAGSVAGHAGMGAGIGAAAGAAGGLIGVLARRGPDVVLPKGTSFEMILDRTLSFTDQETRHGAR